MKLLNKILLQLFVILSPLYIKSQTNQESQTIIVQNPGNNNDIQPNLQAAVNNASNGDVVVLPAGQFVVNKSIVITKFISVKGQGLKSTVLYRSENTPDDVLTNNGDWDGILKFSINNTASSNIIISDLTLKSKKPSLVENDRLSKAEDIGINIINCVDFVITRCRFEYFGNGGISVRHDDSIVGGLIYKNEFVHNTKGYNGLGLGYGVVIYGANRKWISNPRFGSANFVFIEDNLFDYHRHAIAAGGAALYVFRYNTVSNNNIGGEWASHAIDAHGANTLPGSENYYSTRAVEVYNNSIINTTFIDGKTIAPGQHPKMLVEKAICIRGGEALIHDNYIKGYRFGVGVVVTTPDNASGKYVVPYQQGYLSGLKYGESHTGTDAEKGNGDNFIWNNNFNFYDKSNSANTFFYNYSTDEVKEERDYHLAAKPGYEPYIYPHPLIDKLLKK